MATTLRGHRYRDVKIVPDFFLLVFRKKQAVFNLNQEDMKMTKSTLALAIMALVGSGAAFAASPNVQGGSSNPAGVVVGSSNHSLFGGGNSGVALDGAGSYIDLAGGPIKGSNTAIAARGDGTIMRPADIGMLPLPIDIAQVWNATDSSNGANFAINSIRQITQISLAPQFGGLVIGQVANASGTPLAVGSGVYFGEWAPRAAGTPPNDSTDLNMGSASRTVWYVGDNAVSSMPTAVNATYGVVGINGVGTAAGGTPDNPNLYKGTLTASYGSGSGSISGTLTRAGSSNVDFAGTTIHNDGRFTRGSGSSEDINGRFYNGAQALAGIHKAGAGVADDVAFGGSKISGTITP
ncbi:Slam-dependent surface lipoprotein [Stutzerimonas nitrititolerans]|uniref:Slam-dependent surface lipoprotein n=1 Tax=Stutzerimonas nitrititolerans TaxID=2482751 RepID=UPI0028B1C0D7|nr:Slam-dependent surface lipoprotein [Stutzerimonas nitrititolerans]